MIDTDMVRLSPDPKEQDGYGGCFMKLEREKYKMRRNVDRIF